MNKLQDTTVQKLMDSMTKLAETRTELKDYTICSEYDEAVGNIDVFWDIVCKLSSVVEDLKPVRDDLLKLLEDQYEEYDE